jgi:hypothetical protein
MTHQTPAPPVPPTPAGDLRALRPFSPHDRDTCLCHPIHAVRATLQGRGRPLCPVHEADLIAARATEERS